MLISELSAALQKVQQVAGDIPVVLKDIEHGVETELRALGIHIDPSSGSASSTVELEHAVPTQAPVSPPSTSTPVEG